LQNILAKKDKLQSLHLLAIAGEFLLARRMPMNLLELMCNLKLLNLFEEYTLSIGQMQFVTNHFLRIRSLNITFGVAVDEKSEVILDFTNLTLLKSLLLHYVIVGEGEKVVASIRFSTATTNLALHHLKLDERSCRDIFIGNNVKQLTIIGENIPPVCFDDIAKNTSITSLSSDYLEFWMTALPKLENNKSLTSLFFMEESESRHIIENTMLMNHLLQPNNITLHNLTTLILDVCSAPIDINMMKSLCKYGTNLTSLSLLSNSIMDGCTSMISKYATKLRVLCFDGCSGITDASILPIMTMTNLERLEISNGHMTSAVAPMIALNKNLRELTLIADIGSDALRIIIENNDSLESLYVGDTHVTDQVIDSLAKNTRLTSLSLSFVSRQWIDVYERYGSRISFVNIADETAA
jgi:hypothetical protein